MAYEPWYNELCIYDDYTRFGDHYSHKTILYFTDKRIDRIIYPEEWTSGSYRVRRVKDVARLKLMFVKMAFGISGKQYGGVVYPYGGEPDDFYDKRP